MKHIYTPPEDQEQKQLISVGIYSAKCLSVIDGTSGKGNDQATLECEIESMKLRFRLVLISTTAWKVKQTRKAFGFFDAEGTSVSFDTAEFVGKSALCLVGYGEKLAKSGDPYIEIVEFIEPSKEIVAQDKLAKIIASEKKRKAALELDNADVIRF
jgi:hypothetical protein